MNNLGKANVKVEILQELPGIIKDPTEFNFDVTSYQWNSIINSPYFPPQLAEYIVDQTDSFGAIFPTKRKLYINNYIKSATGSLIGTFQASSPYISWTAISDFSRRGVVSDIARKYPTYTLMQPGEDYSRQRFLYNGPEWNVVLEQYTPPPDDLTTMKKWASSTQSAFIEDKINEGKTNSNLYYVNWLFQQKALDGLWWGIESNPFLPVIGDTRSPLTSMSFCVNLKILERPPKTTVTSSSTTLPPYPSSGAVAVTSDGYDTQFIISLGLDDDNNSFDIVVKQNGRPYILDYTLGRNESGGANDIGSSIIIKEFEDDLSRVLDSQDEIEISIMTIAGRLVVWINKVYLIYTRVNKEEGDNAGTIKECKIANGRIAIYGSNVQAKINVCPLIYAPFAAFAMPLASVIENTGSEPITISYKGVSNKYEIGGSTSQLPQQPDKPGKLFGVDCLQFLDSIRTLPGGTTFTSNIVSPKGFAFHCMGKIYFLNAGRAGVTGYDHSDFYIVLMQSGGNEIDGSTIMTMPDSSEYPIYNWGCPFYFRLKGGYRRGVAVPSLTPVEVPEVFSVTESASAPDYFHSLTNATVVIYNKGGRYDYLRNSQYGIRLSWGWGEDLVQTFVGVIINASNSEVAGKEVLTLQCEDYMVVLKNTPIVNSPFYDGMVAFYALADLAKRGGVLTCINDMTSSDDYFLPSGYTFSKPVMRFPASNMLFQCMMEIVKRFEAFVHFDAFGRLHVYKLPGGLFASVPPGTVMTDYKRDPLLLDVSNIILNEKNVEYNFASTVNEISILSVERESRNAILYNMSAASTGEDHLKYKKVFLYNQAALGEIEAVRKWAREVSKRMFYPIRKTNFMTVGNSYIASDTILDFVKVDGLEYRVMSLTRKYDAETNNFTTEYGVEWLGGR